MPRLSRLWVVIAVLFVTADAGLCPILCLIGDTGAHESSVPPPPNQSGGVCGSVLTAAAADARWEATGNTETVIQPLGMRLGLAPTFDIDHPPRLS